MNKTKQTLILIGVIIAIVAFITTAYIITRMPTNPEDATGNTAGNLMNDGMFCEHKGRIYFANPYDNNCLYSMKNDCTDLKKLSNDTVSSINAYGKYIYYVRNNSLKMNVEDVGLRGQIFAVVRAKLNGKDASGIITGLSWDMTLDGNRLIFNTVEESKNVTASIDITGENYHVIFEDDIDNYCLKDNKLYYSKKNDNHNIYCRDLDTGADTLYLKGNTYKVLFVDDILYYIDLDNDYALTKINLTTNIRSVLTTDRVVRYNVYGNMIFYQSEDPVHELVCMDTTGNMRRSLFNGDVSTIGCTSTYTFFTDLNSNSLYRYPTNGTGTVERIYLLEE